MTPAAGVFGSAVVSDDARYRYRLTRTWPGPGGAVLLIGLNPSSAERARRGRDRARMVGVS